MSDKANKQKIEDWNVFERLINGDGGAFDLLFKKFYPGLLRFARTLLPHPSDEAEDIISDVFCNLWENRAKINIHSSVAGYLYTATRNHILNKHKKAKLILFEMEDSVNEIADVNYQLPDDLMTYKEIDKRILELINLLPERTRQVFIMNRDEDLTYEEIASALNISINTVKTHMFRALRFLKSAFYTILLALQAFW
ncbi:RNA polymerase sigma factor [Pedobacter sp. BS3]|uniref:RNA polymerase sigma factor n=1 Tax=Pedobacter sp. BS3 TaxID=2567937 RepID=UPI001659570B|nr:RNA polymerase sigma-70 factor [Pedobacter sp. BS3]